MARSPRLVGTDPPFLGVVGLGDQPSVLAVCGLGDAKREGNRAGLWPVQILRPGGPARLAQGRPAGAGLHPIACPLPVARGVRRARCSPVNRIAVGPSPTAAAALFTGQLRMSLALVGWV